MLNNVFKMTLTWLSELQTNFIPWDLYQTFETMGKISLIKLKLVYINFIKLLGKDDSTG